MVAEVLDHVVALELAVDEHVYVQLLLHLDAVGNLLLVEVNVLCLGNLALLEG